MKIGKAYDLVNWKINRINNNLQFHLVIDDLLRDGFVAEYMLLINQENTAN